MIVRCIPSQTRKTYEGCLKVWSRRWRPGRRYYAVEWVLLLGAVNRLHEERGAVLRLSVRLLRIHTAVQAAVTILRKERVDGFYSGLRTGNTKR